MSSGYSSSSASGYSSYSSNSYSLGSLSVSYSDATEYRAAFTNIANGKNHIRGHQLALVLRDLGSHSPSADVQTILEQADGNHDGKLNYREFVEMMQTWKGGFLRLLREAFKVIDNDHDDYLRPKELRTIMASLGSHITKKGAKKMMGDSSKVDFPAFCRRMGYTGNTSMSLSSLSSVSSSSSSSSSSSTRAPVLPEDRVNIKVVEMYGHGTYEVSIRGSMTVEDCRKRVGRVVDYPWEHVRLYHKGFPLDSDDQTLTSYHVSPNRPLYLMFLHHEARLDSAFKADGKKPNIDAIWDHFVRGGLLAEKDALKIIKKAKEIMRKEPNMVVVNDPVTIVGDIHGQFYDMAELFSHGGEFCTKSGNTYVFMGDYVDRGYFSMECVLLLLAAKVYRRDKVILLRGNHESKKTTKKYGTMHEAKFKYSKKLYTELIECFEALPVACLVHTAGKKHKILCTHGGLSSRIETLAQIETIHRFREPPKTGPLKDFLWADPAKDNANSKKLDTTYNLNKLSKNRGKAKAAYGDAAWETSTRGKGLKLYTHEAVNYFLKKNEILSVFRAHEQKQHGYEQYKFGPKYKFPAVVTVFSAPNYTDKSMNKGSVVRIEDGQLRIVPFSWRFHPLFHPPKDDDEFERDLDAEDFFMWMHYNHPEVIRKAPMHKLEKEWHHAFDSKHSDEDSNIDDDDFADIRWKFLYTNLMAILRQSDDPRVEKLHKKRSSNMALYYEGIDHFSESLELEAEYELDFASGEEVDDGGGEPWSGSYSQS